MITKQLICDVNDTIYCITQPANYTLGSAVEKPLNEPIAKKIKSITISKNNIKYHVIDASYTEETLNKTWFLSYDKAKNAIINQKN